MVAFLFVGRFPFFFATFRFTKNKSLKVLLIISLCEDTRVGLFSKQSKNGY